MLISLRKKRQKTKNKNKNKKQKSKQFNLCGKLTKAKSNFDSN